MVVRIDVALTKLPSRRLPIAWRVWSVAPDLCEDPAIGNFKTVLVLFLAAGARSVGRSMPVLRVATALTERTVEKQFQFCVFDPEGDYDELDHAISVGNMKASPNEEQALKLLEKSATNAVVNTQALEIATRPGFFTAP